MSGTFATLVIPVLRTSPIRIPRRDFVVTAADATTLTLQLVESDDPSALPIEVSGGIGGPLPSLFVWPPQRAAGGPGWGAGWDYGWGYFPGAPATPLWQGDFSLVDAPSATYAIGFPPGPMPGSYWPLRCPWSLLLTSGHGDQSVTLAWGVINIMPGVRRNYAPTAIITTDGSTINNEVLVA
jgi:hypothetical protein